MPLIDKLPAYYASSNIMQSILSSADTALSAANAVADSTDAQFLLQTSTAAGLTHWENIFGLPHYGTVAERRSRLIARKIGVGMCTPAQLITTLETYGIGSPDIVEDNSSYSISISFPSYLGVPSQIDDISRAIRDMLPAHIGFEIIPKYRVIGDFVGKTIAWANNMSIQQLAEWSE